MADRKQNLVARLGEQVRRMGAQSVLISKTVAGRFGSTPVISSAST